MQRQRAACCILCSTCSLLHSCAHWCCCNAASHASPLLILTSTMRLGASLCDASTMLARWECFRARASTSSTPAKPPLHTHTHARMLYSTCLCCSATSHKHRLPAGRNLTLQQGAHEAAWLRTHTYTHVHTYAYICTPMCTHTHPYMYASAHAHKLHFPQKITSHDQADHFPCSPRNDHADHFSCSRGSDHAKHLRTWACA